MGLLDLPAPLFAWLDLQAGTFMPATLRLVLWALAASALSMLLYRQLSPQHRIAQIEAATLRVRRALAVHDGDMADGLRLSRRMLSLAFARLRIVSLPALTAALPVVCLMAWLSTSYGHMLPGVDSQVSVHASPQTARAVWIPDRTGPAPRVAALDGTGRVVEEKAITAPVTTVHKRAWWNVLVGNPLGYLQPDGPVDRIDLDLPRSEYLPFGPSWLRGWEFLFIGVMLIGSLALKATLRIR
jgi:hypothetical protein